MKHFSKIVADITIERDDNLDFGSPAYAALFESSSATPFQHPIWLANFYKILGSGEGREPVIIKGTDETGALVFVLPLLLHTQYGIRIIEGADLGVSDYCCPIIRGSSEETLIARRDLDSAVKALLPAYDILRIRHVRCSDRRLWLPFFQDYFREKETKSHDITISQNWDAQYLSKNTRGNLKRKLKKLSQVDRVKLVDREDPSDALGQIAEFRRGRFQNDILFTEEYRKFYEAILADGIPGDFACVNALEAGDDTVSIAFNIHDRGHFCAIMIAGDYENFGKYSPGLLLDYKLIDERRKRGDTTYDFTIGNETFKTNLGATPRSVYCIEKGGSTLGVLLCRVLQWALKARDKMSRLYTIAPQGAVLLLV